MANALLDRAKNRVGFASVRSTVGGAEVVVAGVVVVSVDDFFFLPCEAGAGVDASSLEADVPSAIVVVDARFVTSGGRVVSGNKNFPSVVKLHSSLYWPRSQCRRSVEMASSHACRVAAEVRRYFSMGTT